MLRGAREKKGERLREVLQGEGGFHIRKKMSGGEDRGGGGGGFGTGDITHVGSSAQRRKKRSGEGDPRTGRN